MAAEPSHDERADALERLDRDWEKRRLDFMHDSEGYSWEPCRRHAIEFGALFLLVSGGLAVLVHPAALAFGLIGVVFAIFLYRRGGAYERARAEYLAKRDVLARDDG